MYSKFLFFLCFAFALIYAVIYCYHQSTKTPRQEHGNASEVILVTVVCGLERTEEAFVMIKSALMFLSLKHRLKFVVVTEKSLFQMLDEKLAGLQSTLPNFSFKIFEVDFPKENSENWRSLFKPCASQRLFLPTLLPYERVVYVDCDTLFLSSPYDMFQLFNRFNSTQIAGLSIESESLNIGWYPRFAAHPFYGKFGVNSGVMLMNLERMRKVKWEQKLLPIFEEYNLSLVFGDQDIINIYFHFHPDQLQILPCELNYRPDHCMYETYSLCPAHEGVKLIHGNRGYFHKPQNQPIFSQIYNTIQRVSKNTETVKISSKSFLSVPTELEFVPKLHQRLREPSSGGRNAELQQTDRKFPSDSKEHRRELPRHHRLIRV